MRRYALLLMILAASPALAAEQERARNEAPAESRNQGQDQGQGQGQERDRARPANRAGEIATQPLEDAGVRRIEVPPVLQRAVTAPYARPGRGGCATINGELAGLNEALGPDLPVASNNGRTPGRIAEAGGRTIVNSIIPFRSLVRELTGAAAADRRLQEAVEAGFARRGYLRGLAEARGCRRV